MLRISTYWIALFFVFFNVSAQLSVDESMSEIQVSTGIWFANETRLKDQISLRSKIGVRIVDYSTGSTSVSIDNGVRTTTIDNTLRLAYALQLMVEPRFYYNFSKRVEKSKKITNNSGNFLAVRFSYVTDFNGLMSRNYAKDYDYSVRFFYITPMWGIRRNYLNKISFEAGAGIGPYWEDRRRRNEYHHDGQKIFLYPLIHLKFGYLISRKSYND